MKCRTPIIIIMIPRVQISFHSQGRSVSPLKPSRVLEILDWTWNPEEASVGDYSRVFRKWQLRTLMEQLQTAMVKTADFI